MLKVTFFAIASLLISLTACTTPSSDDGLGREAIPAVVEAHIGEAMVWRADLLDLTDEAQPDIELRIDDAVAAARRAPAPLDPVLVSVRVDGHSGERIWTVPVERAEAPLALASMLFAVADGATDLPFLGGDHVIEFGSFCIAVRNCGGGVSTQCTYTCGQAACSPPACPAKGGFAPFVDYGAY